MLFLTFNTKCTPRESTRSCCEPMEFDLLRHGHPLMVGEDSNNVSHVGHKTHDYFAHVHDIKSSIHVFTTCIECTFSVLSFKNLLNGSNLLVRYVALS